MVFVVRGLSSPNPLRVIVFLIHDVKLVPAAPTGPTGPWVPLRPGGPCGPWGPAMIVTFAI